MSIIKRGSVSGTGNSVADYTWEVHRCDFCGGRGEIHLDYDKFIKYLKDNHYDKKFKFLYDTYRRWQKNEYYVPCPTCGGIGEYEVKF